MYTLYSHPFSQHSRRVISLLEEARLPYESTTVDLAKGEHHSPEYLAVNPNHQVPTLIDGGSNVKIHESNAILRYLCVKHELSEWYPSELAERAAVEQWLDWSQCRLGPAVVSIVLNKVFMGDKGDEAAIASGREKLRELAPLLEAALDSRAYIASSRPTIADLALVSLVFHLGLADEAPMTSNIKAWFGRMLDLEGVQRSLPKRD